MTEPISEEQTPKEQPKLDLAAAVAAADVGEVSDRLLRTAVLRSQLLRLAMRGMNASQAAKALGCSPEHARKHYADPEFRKQTIAKVESAFAEIDSAFIEKKKTLHERLEEQAERAFEELVTLLESSQTTTGHKIKIAQDFLDRNPTTQAGFVARHTQLNPEQLVAAARTAKEMDSVIPAKVNEEVVT